MLVSSLLKKTPIIFVLCALGIGLIGCGKNPTAVTTNNDATSITPEGIGQIAIESFSEQDSLAGTLGTAGNGLSALSLENQFSITTASSLGKQGLGKISASAVSPIIDLSDTASGKARLIFITNTALVDSHDTLVIKWDDVARDPLEINKNIISVSGERTYIGGKTERYGVTDADNDGVVAGEAKYNGKARFSYQAIQGTTVESLTMEVSAGADKNFNNNADNQIVSLSWEKSRSGEIASRATFADADNDGVLIDKSKTIPCAVDVTLFEKNPLLRPLVDSCYLTMRVLTNGNSTEDKLIRLGGKEYRQSGRIFTLTVTDVHGNEDVLPNDTAIAVFAMIPAKPNGVKDSVRFVFDVQSGLQKSSDNLLYGLHIHKEHLIGPVKSRIIDFTTRQPVSEGQKPKSGHLEMTVTYSNDKSASLSADFTQTGFIGTWIGPNGNTLTVTWGADGTVVSQN
jgi:hypothetical protein